MILDLMEQRMKDVLNAASMVTMCANRTRKVIADGDPDKIRQFVWMFCDYSRTLEVATARYRAARDAAYEAAEAVEA